MEKSDVTHKFNTVQYKTEEEKINKNIKTAERTKRSSSITVISTGAEDNPWVR